MSHRKVVVTGTSVVTALGTHVPDVWNRLKNGDSGLSVTTSNSESPPRTRVVGRINNFDPRDHMSLESRDVRRMDRFVQLAIVASHGALEHAGSVLKHHDAVRCGVIIGSCFGGLASIEEQHARLRERGPGRVSAFFIPAIMINSASGNVAVHWQLKGPSHGLSATCASGIQAIGSAYRMIQSGVADMFVCGGTEAPLCDAGLQGMQAMGWLSATSTSLDSFSKPFEANRDGCVAAEGAGILVLEDLECAERRGATILAEVVGYGQSFGDSQHTSSKDGGVNGPLLAMQAALADASRLPNEIADIHVHACGTQCGDANETAAIESLFGNVSEQSVVSVKGQLGHTFGASGAIEAALCVAAHKRVSVDNYGMVNSFGFGGQNACLVIRRMPDRKT